MHQVTKQDLQEIAVATNRKEVNSTDFSDCYNESCCCKEIMHLMIDGQATEEQKELFQQHISKEPTAEDVFKLHAAIKENVVCQCQNQFTPAPEDVVNNILSQIKKID